MKQLIKVVLRKLGFKLFRLQTIPRGIDLGVDLSRVLSGTKTKMIFDVGANIGQTSKELIQWFPYAKIDAFEPVKQTFFALKSNVAPFKNIRVHQMALGENDGDALMAIMPESGWNHVVVNEDSHNCTKTEIVRMSRIDTFCRQMNIKKISLLKTDCEGFDLFVLKGAHDMLSNKRIDAVYCEVNFRSDGKHGDFFEINSHLKAFDYCFYALYDYSGWSYNVAQVGFTNALWVRSSLLER
jgi:FkbM family methyltransferase